MYGVRIFISSCLLYTSTAGTGAVHPLLQSAGQEDDFGVLAAQFDHSVGIRHKAFHRAGGGENLLHKFQSGGFCHAQSGGTGAVSYTHLDVYKRQLILGIVALITSCSLVLSIPCGIIGLILGIVGKAKGAGGMAVAGIVLSVLALLFTIFFIVCIVVADGAYFWIGSPYTMSMFAR